MKFTCPESQKRVSLKCGSIDSGSVMAVALSGALAASSALAEGVSDFTVGVGIGIGVGSSGCCAYAGIMHFAAAISDNTVRSVLAVQRIDLPIRFPTCPIVNLSA